MGAELRGLVGGIPALHDLVELVGPLVCRVAREPRGLDLLGLQRVVDDDHVGAAAGQHPADRGPLKRD